jgi:hypothetical protein
MLNFLQQQNKKQIVSEYLLRIAVFLLMFTFISSLILISLFATSFFFVKYKNDTLNLQLESAKQKNINVAEDPIVFIKNINRLSAALSSDTGLAATYGDIISKITSLKNNDIKILSIVITEENSTNVRQIDINGIAGTRDSLIQFENDIKTDGFFSSVIFPVSDFIKSSDSEFSATLIL